MASNAFTVLHKQLTDLQVAIARLDATVTATAPASAETLVAYEGLFIRLIVALESYLESFMGELLDGTFNSAMPGFKRIVTFHDTATREAALLHGRDYIDWLPYARTVEVAKLYLKDGVPFSQAKPAHFGDVKKMVRIRHAIAHSSPHAKRLFDEKVIGNAKLPADELSPAGYLIGAANSNPRTSRLANFLAQVMDLARTIDA
ncbi:MAG: hypothetical protein GC200_02370 [Tepidisphaera sp.]|nr:hypothetical protein [Tepidisphaera sp.]